MRRNQDNWNYVALPAQPIQPNSDLVRMLVRSMGRIGESTRILFDSQRCDGVGLEHFALLATPLPSRRYVKACML
ncbi:MAG: hypothetical protein KDA91_19325 [Planctomycetaceae bacterium]|nr:hypothetical protein [Planctomycetaceae bacterium]